MTDQVVRHLDDKSRMFREVPIAPPREDDPEIVSFQLATPGLVAVFDNMGDPAICTLDVIGWGLVRRYHVDGREATLDTSVEALVLDHESGVLEPVSRYGNFIACIPTNDAAGLERIRAEVRSKRGAV